VPGWRAPPGSLEKLVFNVTPQDGQDLKRLQILRLLQYGGNFLGCGLRERSIFDQTNDSVSSEVILSQSRIHVRNGRTSGKKIES